MNNPEPHHPELRSRWVYNTLAALSLLCVSFVMVAAVGELTARLLYPRIANYNLEMWRYFSIFKQVHDNPKLPFTLKPDLQAHLYGVDVRTNSLGLRDREYPVTPAEGTRRIIMMGDSQTFGWGIEEADTLSEILEEKLNAEGQSWEVINFGVGNYNSLMEVEQFRLKGLPLQPDLVILNYFVNDAEAPPYIAKWRFELFRHSYLFAVLFDRYVLLKSRLSQAFNWLDYYESLYCDTNPWLAPNRQALQDLIQMCRDRNIDLVFANYPDLHQLNPYPLATATDFIREIASEHNVPFVDFLPAIQNLRPESLWVSPEDPHGNVQATRPAAKLLYEAVKAMEALPAP
jgi:hypothetical protein